MHGVTRHAQHKYVPSRDLLSPRSRYVTGSVLAPPSLCDKTLSGSEVRGAQICGDLVGLVAVWMAFPGGPVAADQRAEAVRLVIQSPPRKHRRDVVLVREADTPPAWG